jgi:hypothetical protein
MNLRSTQPLTEWSTRSMKPPKYTASYPVTLAHNRVKKTQISQIARYFRKSYYDGALILIIITKMINYNTGLAIIQFNLIQF